MMYFSSGKERCVTLATYLVENKTTVRKVASHFGISKSTVHKDVSPKLKHVNPVMYEIPTETTVEIPATEETAPVESPSWYETSRLIYHAGGEVSGYTYSNSKEAVEKTLSDGNRLLEIDFLFTSDGHLVCLHEWQNLLGMTQPCTLEKFLSVHIFNKFTTITAMNIIDYMAQYPDMYLIVDTKEDSLAAVVTELL